uniref:Uncharacterized protein n=1 Tax=Tanacetum cinerariifolium TaxID=118510 RepID=A0A699KJN0_TANCI|nr:hypothetical protein [Tanacetum cinerariifolium]
MEEVIKKDGGKHGESQPASGSNDKHGIVFVNTRVTSVSGSNEANTIGKNSVVYVNDVGQETINVVVSDNGNESALSAGNKGNQGLILTVNNKGPILFSKLVTGESSRK